MKERTFLKSLLPWLAASAVVGSIAALMSPFLLLMGASCCGSSSHDPTNGVFIIPVQPLLWMLHSFGQESLFPLAFGLAYGFPVALLGAFVVGLRNALRR